MPSYLVKSWEIIGYTFEGSIFCPDCQPQDKSVTIWGIDVAMPIFADQQEMIKASSCSTCSRIVGA